jgi:hypothetical protein
MQQWWSFVDVIVYSYLIDAIEIGDMQKITSKTASSEVSLFASWRSCQYKKFATISWQRRNKGWFPSQSYMLSFSSHPQVDLIDIQTQSNIHFNQF